MKRFKKNILMMLSLILTLSLVQTTRNVRASTSFYYVALGDNATAGYTLADAGGNVKDPAKNYKADSASTYGNITAVKLMSLTDNTGSVYNYYSNLGTVNATIADMQKSISDSSDPYYTLYNTEIKKASDITVNCGTTDFLDQILTITASMGLGDHATTNTYNDMTVYDNADNPLIAAAYSLIAQMANGKVYTEDSLKADINSLIDYYAGSVSSDTATDMMNMDTSAITAQAQTALDEALGRYGALLDSIAALNGDADLYVVGMYKEFGTELSYNGSIYTLDGITNELKSNLASYVLQMALKGSRSVAQNILNQYGYQLFYLVSGEIYDTAVDSVNAYLKDYCAQKGYTYVDISSLSSDSDLNPYPDSSEHAYIAEQVYQAIAPKYTNTAHTHTIVTDMAVAATCTQAGLTQGSHCLVCGEVIEKQQVVSALGHDYQAVVTKEPTVLEEGVRTYTCTRCKDSYTEAIPVISHTHQYADNIVKPTYESQGYTVHICRVCGDTYIDSYTDQLVFPFTDVPNKWYYPWIYKAYGYGLMTGKTTTTFDPLANMNRGQVAVVLYRMAGSPEVEYKGTFADVAEGKYYAKAIEWAAANNIVTGYVKEGSPTTFKPTENITRQDFILMLYRYAGKPEVNDTSNLNNFPDGNFVSGYAKNAMSWAIANGIITGKQVDDQTCIAPKATASRAECCKMLVVTYEMLNGIE